MSETGALTLATLCLSVITIGVVVVAARQVHVTRRALETSIRPLLADSEPMLGEAEIEQIQFGAPGRASLPVRPGALYFNHDGSMISVPFRNIGAGVAVITKATTKPGVEGSVEVTRRFVPVGEYVRVNISSIPSDSGVPVSAGKMQPGQRWAMQPFQVSVHYTDAAGRQPLISRASFSQAETHGPWIESIAILRKGKRKPFAVGRSTI